MRQTKFALQPLLEQRKHCEEMRREELTQARRTRDAVAHAVKDAEHRYRVVLALLARCVSEGRLADARAHDATLGVLDRARQRRCDEVRKCDAAVATAAASLTTANRERRTLERLRERLAARRARRYDDDD